MQEGRKSNPWGFRRRQAMTRTVNQSGRKRVWSRADYRRWTSRLHRVIFGIWAWGSFDRSFALIIADLPCGEFQHVFEGFTRLWSARIINSGRLKSGLATTRKCESHFDESLLGRMNGKSRPLDRFRRAPPPPPVRLSCTFALQGR